MTGQNPIRIGMVAGENSGDILGADLIQHLKMRFPNAQFEGIGGDRMIAEGLQSFFPLERLAVMGFFEPLKRLPELLRIRHFIIQHFKRNPPDIFVGVDAPDFNLGIEKSLKKAAIRTAHYVGPTVWAWRQGRLKTIKKAVDLMLTLFPFENAIYEKAQIPVTCVGHPLADQIPEQPDMLAAREALGLPMDRKIVAIMPGSRRQELRYLGPTFLQAATLLQAEYPNMQFISAFPDPARVSQFEMLRSDYPQLPFEVFLSKSQEVMAAADAVLISSGTGALESMLVKRPTIVSYKMAPVTYWLARKIIDIPYVALPNILANDLIMPEYIQEDATPESLANAVLATLAPTFDRKALADTYAVIHRELKRNAGETGANAIYDLIHKETTDAKDCRGRRGG